MIYIISNAFVCVCALISFIYGITQLFKPKKALYAQMIVLGVGCIAFGRLYQLVRLLTGGDILNEFQLGILGVIGSLMFFFSSNFGAMDSLADDKSKKYAKYRLIAFAAPLTALALYVGFLLLFDATRLWKIVGGVVTFFIMQTTYFNLKHLIFPDVDYGVINCLKPYNAAVLFYALFCIADIIALTRESEVAVAVVSAQIGITVLLITPLLVKGVRKWTT